MLELTTLQEKVRNAEADVSRAKSLYGESSQEYKDALKQFAVNWFVLKQTRDPEEFLEGLI